MAGASDGVTVIDVNDLYTGTRRDPALLRRAIALKSLPAGWRDHFRAMADKIA